MAPLTDFPELLRLAATLLLDQPRQRRLHSADDVAAYGVEVRSPAGDLLGELVRAAPDGPDVAHDTLIRGALAHGLLLLADSRMPRMREIGDLMLQFSTGVRILCREDNAELRAELLALHQRIDAELPADDPRRRSLQALRELVDGDPLLLARRDLVAVLEDKADRLAPNISLVDLLRVAATVLREYKEAFADTQRRLEETIEVLAQRTAAHREDAAALGLRSAEVQDLQQRLADQELAAKKRQATVDRQGNELGGLRAERARLIDRIAELDRERHALKTELDQTGRLRDAQREIEQARVRQDVLTADRDMWRRRTERLQAWFALPPDQRHPLGPEVSGSLSQSMEMFVARIAQLPRNGLDDAQHIREAIPTVRLYEEAGVVATVAAPLPDEAGQPDIGEDAPDLPPFHPAHPALLGPTWKTAIVGEVESGPVTPSQIWESPPDGVVAVPLAETALGRWLTADPVRLDRFRQEAARTERHCTPLTLAEAYHLVCGLEVAISLPDARVLTGALGSSLVMLRSMPAIRRHLPELAAALDEAATRTLGVVQNDLQRLAAQIVISPDSDPTVCDLLGLQPGDAPALAGIDAAGLTSAALQGFALPTEMLGLPEPLSPELAAATVDQPLAEPRKGPPCPACNGAGGSCGGMCAPEVPCEVCGGTGLALGLNDPSILARANTIYIKGLGRTDGGVDPDCTVEGRKDGCTYRIARGDLPAWVYAWNLDMRVTVDGRSVKALRSDPATGITTIET